MNRALELNKKRRGPVAPVAAAVIAELKTLTMKNHGLLMPEDVVEAARNKDSPLHSKFEWDDGEAAGRWRIWQARHLISISVEYLPLEGRQQLSKVFVSLSTDRRTGGYRTFVDVVANDNRRSQMIQDSLEAMDYFREKYRRLSELQNVFKAMDKAAQKLKRK